MSDDKRKQQLEAARQATIKKYNDPRAAALGSERIELNVVPTPSLMLDYKLGLGGVPYGHMVEVFGSNNLGKTTVIGYGTLANVQRQGKLPALIAMEPTFDPDWATALHGLDPDLLLICRPDNAEDAFEMLHDLVYEGLVDYILLDSIGAMAAKSETEDGGKRKAYGVSGTVTSGLNAIMPRLHKNNQGLMIINQVRQSGSFNGHTMFDSPGGEGLKHHAAVRLQLKPGREKYRAKIDGEDVVIGRELIVSQVRNKLAQATDKAARFDFYNIDTNEHGLGIDHVSDIINTAKIAGVIESAGAWLRHKSFPDGKLQGKAALQTYMAGNPKIAETIRDEVLTHMVERQLEKGKQ